MTPDKTNEIPECSMWQEEGVERMEGKITITECLQCKDYQEIQDIKTKRIKELKKQLDVAREALKYFSRVGLELPVCIRKKAMEALRQIEEVE